MMSQTHILLGAALFARPGKPLRNTAVIAGSLLPDAAIFGLFFWSKLAGIPERTVWNELYWQEPWQTYTAAGNSIPLYLALLLLGVVLLRAVPGLFKLGLGCTFLTLAALAHVLTDFFVHVTDAHRHFWPLSDWKFVSSVSYWDPNHHGGVFQIFEGLLGVGLCVILFRRFSSIVVRAFVLVAMAAYVAVPAYFIFQLGSG